MAASISTVTCAQPKPFFSQSFKPVCVVVSVMDCKYWRVLSMELPAAVFCRAPNSEFDDVSEPVTATPNQPSTGEKRNNTVVIPTTVNTLDANGIIAVITAPIECAW